MSIAPASNSNESSISPAESRATKTPKTPKVRMAPECCTDSRYPGEETTVPPSAKSGEINNSTSEPKAAKAPKKPSVRKISKKGLQEALSASLAGGMTEEHRAVLKAYEANPGALLGVSAKEYQSITQTGELIHQEGEEQELLVAAQALILCGLPYKPLMDENGRPVTHYKRTARTPRGTISLTVAAADPDIPLPYGKDRAALAWLQTKAKRQGNPKVEWSSASEYFTTFGLNNSGRTYKQFRDTWRRLGNVVFTIEISNDSGGSKGRLIPLLEEWDLPSAKDLRTEAKGQRTLPGLQHSVTLSPTLWKHLQAGAIPLRLEIMRHFQDEPKGWDFVALICYESWLCERSKKAGYNSVERISWKELALQIGTTDLDTRRLRSTLRTILNKLKTIWPECRADLERGGDLVIKPPINSIHPVKDR